MAKKIKLIPVNLDAFDFFQVGVPQQSPVEIIAPKSYEQETEMSVNTGVGILGNTIVGQRYFLEREYNMNWVGDKKEIDKVRFYLSQTSTNFFMLGGLTENKIITPSVMYNSKSMLASLVDQHRPVGSQYQNYLPRYAFSKAPRRGSTGIQLSRTYPDVEDQFNSLLGNTTGANAYVFLEKGHEYSWKLDPNYMMDTGEHPHNVVFNMTAVAMDYEGGGVVNQDYKVFSSVDEVATFLPKQNADVVARITVGSPRSFASQYNNPQFRSILNYSAPIIGRSEYFESDSILDNTMSEVFDEIPSLLSPVNSGVYNMINRRVAEFSISFKEIVYELPR